jgi:hypothetical protein
MPDQSSENADPSGTDRDGQIRIFIFKSETRPDLCAFGGDLAGIELPSQFKPWRAVGAVAPSGDFRYNLSRRDVEAAIKDRGFQLFRYKKKAKVKP